MKRLVAESNGSSQADPFGHATPGPEYGFLFAAESVGVEELHTPNNRDESSSDNHAPTTLTSQLTEKKIHFGFNSHLSTHLTKNQGPVGAPIDPVGYQAEPPAFGSEQSSSATNPENDDPTWTNEQTGLTGRVMVSCAPFPTSVPSSQPLLSYLWPHSSVKCGLGLPC